MAKVVVKATFGRDIRRLPLHRDDLTYDDLLLMIQRVFKLGSDDDIHLKYRDEDGDLVTIVETQDVAHALQQSNILRVMVYVGPDQDGNPGNFREACAQMKKVLGEFEHTLEKFMDSAPAKGRREARALPLPPPLAEKKAYAAEGGAHAGGAQGSSTTTSSSATSTSSAPAVSAAAASSAAPGGAGSNANSGPTGSAAAKVFDPVQPQQPHGGTQHVTHNYHQQQQQQQQNLQKNLAAEAAQHVAIASSHAGPSQPNQSQPPVASSASLPFGGFYATGANAAVSAAPVQGSAGAVNSTTGAGAFYAQPSPSAQPQYGAAPVAPPVVLTPLYQQHQQQQLHQQQNQYSHNPAATSVSVAGPLASSASVPVVNPYAGTFYANPPAAPSTPHQHGTHPAASAPSQYSQPALAQGQGQHAQYQLQYQQQQHAAVSVPAATPSGTLPQGYSAPSTVYAQSGASPYRPAQPAQPPPPPFQPAPPGFYQPQQPPRQ